MWRSCIVCRAVCRGMSVCYVCVLVNLYVWVVDGEVLIAYVGWWSCMCDQVVYNVDLLGCRWCLGVYYIRGWLLIFELK